MQDSEKTLQFSTNSKFPLITYGLPFPEACSKHISGTLGCSKVFVIISGSINRNSNALERLEVALGRGTIVGTRKGMTPHVLLTETLETAADVKASGADCIVTLGGGSLVDAAKLIRLAITNDADTIPKVEALMKESMKFSKLRGNVPEPWQPHFKQSTIKIVSITTTLSGGEYNGTAGGTNPETLCKHVGLDPSAPAGPEIIVWDAELTSTTPIRTWLGSGLRSIDHCVETFCSGPNVSPGAKESGLRGTKLLISSLLRTKEFPNDLEARLKSQMGGMDSMRPAMLYGARIGGSHGIGHQLGPFGVPHGECTAIMLPAVVKFNASVVRAQQEELLEVFWSVKEVATMLRRRGLVKGTSDLGDALDAYIRELGLPRSLKEFGIGRDKFEAIAENSVMDRCCWWNPIPLTKKEQVLEIMKAVLVD